MNSNVNLDKIIRARLGHSFSYKRIVYLLEQEDVLMPNLIANSMLDEWIIDGWLLEDKDFDSDSRMYIAKALIDQ